jgi:hypothetical protein
MLRRRLSALAKLSLHVAHECVQSLPQARLVYASRHGELSKTTAMLHDLAREEALSPTAFSLSVLNATVGVFSILRQDTSPATAIAAAENSFGYGLLEACAQLNADPSIPVLLIYADEPIPEIYQDRSAMPAHAIALLLSNDATEQIDCRIQSESRDEERTEAQSLAFLRCLRSRAPSEWRHANRVWRWAHRNGARP